MKTKGLTVTPDYKIVPLTRDCLRPIRVAAGWFLRLLLIAVGVGVILHNQYVLSNAVRAVEELKQDLLLIDSEKPIKKILDEKTDQTLNELEKIRIAKLIKASEIVGIDPAFAIDLIERESSFNPAAVSNKGAIGLMQLLPSTARWLAEKEGLPWRGIEALFDPVTNVRFGTIYLAYLSSQFRDEELLRAAYQQGPARVRARKGGSFYARNP